MTDTDFNSYAIEFYNIENLFDIENVTLTNDDDFLPTSAERGTAERYENKLLKLGRVIFKIGQKDTKIAPIIIGLAEVENSKVVSDLLRRKNLISERLSYSYYDSSDERGIDVALLYKSNLFKVKNSETFSIHLQTKSGEQNYTRDLLLVQCNLNN
jgi:predicted AAA+ superfamily ATPase